AQHQSLSKAAKAMNISQSSISAAVDMLEAELGLILFYRQRSKGISLTAVGRDVLPRIQGILDQVDNFDADITGIEGQISGTLHVECFTPIAPFILPPIIKELSIAHPSIKIHIHEGNVRDNFDRLRRGEVDVAISYDDADIGAGLIRRLLASVPPHVIAPMDHPFAQKPSISLKDLDGIPLILMDLPSSRQYYTSLFAAVGVQPNFIFKSGSYELVRSLVGAGVGLALLQSRPPVDITSSGTTIQCIPIKDKLPHSALVVACTEQDFKRRAVEVFMQQCVSYFNSAKARHLIVSTD
ncbi:MAG: LysR substrate-binding domain-containing protein, partial [Sneathiella sp.]